MRKNYTVTITIWTIGDDIKYPDCHDTQVWFFEQLNEASKAIQDIAGQIDVIIPKDFWGINRKSPSGTFNSFGWSHGVLTFLKLID